MRSSRSPPIGRIVAAPEPQARSLEYMVRERGAQFDPNVVDCLITAITGEDSPPSVASTSPAKRPPAGSRAPKRPSRLPQAIAELDVIPVFGPACERALASAFDVGAGPELIGAIESDIGLTVAVLALAGRDCGTAAASVSDAVARSRPPAIGAAIAQLPRLTFPWQTGFEALLLQSRAHAQAVARATDRLAQHVRPFDRDELVAAALVHDVGKLLLAKIWPGFGALAALRHIPEELLAHERRNLGYDHATLGAMLVQRWDLHEGIMTAVSRHHSAQRAGAVATLVCRRHRIVPGGDHVVLIGEVLDHDRRPGPALLFHDGEYRAS